MRTRYEPAAGRQASGAQSLATARAPGRHHLAAARGCHAGAETVPAFAHQFARLIGPLHDSISAGRNRLVQMSRGLYGRRGSPVNARRNLVKIVNFGLEKG